MMSWAAAITWLTSGLCFAAQTAPQQEFHDRVAEYLKLRKRLAASAPPLKAKTDAEAIQAHKEALARALVVARADAKQGNIFTPSVQAYLVEIIRSEMRGNAGGPARAAVKQGNPANEVPAAPVPVKVNGIYPDSAPLSTVPPTLLLRLPTLPKELEFRFVGKHLILRDVSASIIVDLIPNAMR